MNEHNDTPSLLPCPFCGVNLTLQGDYTHESAWNYFAHPEKEDSDCILAPLTIGVENDFRTPNREEADAWNTRQSTGTTERPLDVVLFCPNCKAQHIDKAEPDVCEDCGHTKEYHGREFYRPEGNTECLHCSCMKFKAWLNPPHKSHRCHSCNTVFRPADVPTNGVERAQTAGKNDTKSLEAKDEQ